MSFLIDFLGKIILLFIIHPLFFICSWVSHFYKLLRSFIFAKKCHLDKMPKYPSSLALLIDKPSKEDIKKIESAIQFSLTIPNLQELVVFTHKSTINFGIEDDRIFYCNDNTVSQEFMKEMKRDGKIENHLEPFQIPLELCIVYSQYANLCNFFPWKLDLATIVYGGMIRDISPETILSSLDGFAHQEQRHGK